VTLGGNAFHARAPATGNARSSSEDRRVAGTMTSVLEDERSVWQEVHSSRYSTTTWRNRQTIRRTLTRHKQEAPLTLTNRATRLEVSQGHQRWYHSIR